MSDDLTERLAAFAGGMLSEDELQVLEAEIDRRPSLQRALAKLLHAHTEHTVPEPLRPSTRPSSHARHVSLGSILGAGGMGVVRHGRQESLSRQVAVKMLKELSTSGSERLLKEARITGRLEHPNIVPVHDIIFDDDTGPQVVLKKIDGIPMSKLMHDAPAVRERFGADDLLEHNIGVLLAVCRALAFAHSHGVIHRDVKPSNIMVGTFGEVYLLDWGLAASVVEDPTGELPTVFDGGVGGTPAYAAPEQLEGDPGALGRWTDVYLLGATLYHVLAKHPPHSSNVDEVPPRKRVVNPLPDAVPAELAVLVQKMLAPNPEDRPVSIDEVRVALEEFLRHRGSHRLVASADERAETARGLREQGDRRAAELASAEAAFGYRAALEMWASNSAAKAGALELGRERIEDALDHDEAPRARALLDELDDAPSTLKARVDRAMADHEAKQREAKKLAADVDRSVGFRVRRVAIAIFGIGWMVMFGWTGVAMPRDLVPLASVLGVALVLGTIFITLRRQTMLENRLNRLVVSTSLAVVATLVLWLFGAAAMGVDSPTALATVMLICAAGSGIGTLNVDLRSSIVPLVWLAAFGASVLRPEWTGPALIVASVVQVLGFLAVNRLVERGAEPRA